MMNKQEIWHGDCLELMKNIPDKSVDLVILDPPYNIGAAKWDKIENYLEWMKRIITLSLLKLKDSGSFYMWGMSKNNDFLRLKIWLDEQDKFIFRNWVVWIHDVKIHRKPNNSFLTKHEDLLFYSSDKAIFNQMRDDPPENQLKIFKGKYNDDFFVDRSNLPPSQQKIFKNGLQLGSPVKSWWKGPANKSNGKTIKHAGYKSEWVSERIIKASSKKYDLVLIPFAGSGTECLAAKNLNRQFIGIEEEKEYYDICVERLK